MGLGKFSHPSLYMGIPVVSYCCHEDGSGEFIPDGDLPIANTSLAQLNQASISLLLASQNMFIWLPAHLSQARMSLCLVGLLGLHTATFSSSR